MPALLSYAKARGVKTRLLLPGDALKLQDLEKVFSTYQPNSTPDHEVEVGIIRGAVSPMDTHQGSFRPVPAREFQARTLRPNSIGTLSHQLSTDIVYENEQLMLADYPEAYEKHLEAFEFVRDIPLVWDETKILRADLSEHV